MKRSVTFFLINFVAITYLVAQTFDLDSISYKVRSSTLPYTVGVTGKTPEYTGDVVIPEQVIFESKTYSVISIEENAFSNCYVTSVSIPNSVKDIGMYAFRNCNGLTFVTIPNSVKYIGTGAFASCSDLESINVDTGNENYVSFDGVLYNKDKTILLQCPGGKDYISITSIPLSMTAIGDFAFSNCSKLMFIDILFNVKTIGMAAFAGCTSLTVIRINELVTSIGDVAFTGCSNLTSLDVDERNQNYAALDDVLYNKNLTTLLQFPGAKTSFEIPDSVITIGRYAFFDCIGLTSVTIPNSVITIEESAFKQCTGLTSITCFAESPPFATNCFTGVPKTIPINVPCTKVENYEAAPVWNNFENINGIKPLTDTASHISGDILVCQGETAVTYSAPAISNADSYIWTLPTGATGASSTYSIDVDFGTSAISGDIAVKGINACGEGETSILAITVIDKPDAPVISINDNVLQSNASSGNQWYNQDGLINDATDQYYSATSDGDYYVIVSINGCSSGPSNSIRYEHTGIELTKLNKTIKLYPNPVSNELIVETDGNNEKLNFEILNSIGQIICKSSLYEKAAVQTTGFAPGVYIIKLEKGTTLEFKKIIKK